MAKKKKYENIKLEQNELTPIAIGSFGNKKKNSIGAFIIITMFILVVIFLPEISDYVNKFLNNSSIPNHSSSANNSSNNGNNGEINNQDDNFYEFSNILKLDREEISVSDFVIGQTNTISYNITNKNDSYLNLDTLNYFLEIYDKDKALIERVKLANNISLSSNETKNVTRNISSEAKEKIGYVVLIKKNISDYPAVELNTNEDNTSSLTCTRLDEKVTYKFTKNLLKEITHLYSYDKTNEEYETIYNDAKSLSNSYNNKTGIT